MVREGNEGRLAATHKKHCAWGAVMGWEQHKSGVGGDESGRCATPRASSLVSVPTLTGQYN